MKLVKLLLAAVLSLSLLGVVLPVLAAPDVNVTMSLSPASKQVVKGSTLTVAVNINPAGHSIVGADAVIDYNPSDLQYVSKTSGTVFGNVADGAWYTINNDTTNGVLRIGGVKDPNNSAVITSGGTLMTLNFTAIGTVNTVTQLTFEFTSGSTTDSNVAAQGGGDILGTVVNGSYTIVQSQSTQGALDSVVLLPATTSLTAGQTQQFTAAAYDSQNNLLTSGITFAWSLSPSLGSVSSAGLYTAPASIASASSTVLTVSATSGDGITKSDTSVITLLPAAASGVLDHVSISPSSTNLGAGQSQQFIAAAYDASNQLVSNANFSWSINPDTGTISSTGFYTAPATIASSSLVNVTVFATSGSVTKTASAVVTLLPGQSTATTTTSTTSTTPPSGIPVLFYPLLVPLNGALAFIFRRKIRF